MLEGESAIEDANFKMSGRERPSGTNEHTASNTTRLTLENWACGSNGCKGSERDFVLLCDGVVENEMSDLRSDWKEQGKLE
jgi:hypothetical protein